MKSGEKGRREGEKEIRERVQGEREKNDNPVIKGKARSDFHYLEFEKKRKSPIKLEKWGFN